MKSLSSPLVLLSLAIVACGAPATIATSPTPTPAPATTPTVSTPSVSTSLTTIPPATVTEAPRNWQLLDETTDHIPGISVERAYRELLTGKSPKQTVLVAIIDNGIDTSHVDLKANLWVNPKEIGGNKKDDDNNGYVDDVHGWSFIGGRDGEDVHFDTFEVTREYARCHQQAAASGEPPITDQAYCQKVDADYNKQKADITRNVETYRQISGALQQIIPVLKQAVAPDSLSPDRVRALRPSTPQMTQMRQMYLELASEGATPSVIEDGLKSLEGQLKYALNPDFNPRTIVGDNYTDLSERHYGNADVMGQDAKHGTHVAGIIGALRGNGVGVDGIAAAVKFMMIRTVPDGDERDKDIANAIRYAVDNGANVINMSFGKDFSPAKSVVDEAVRYADQHGVLMIHAAGNDGANTDSTDNFPNARYLAGGQAERWLEVGASSWRGGTHLAADFSNYGRGVDLFAPGEDILSTVPGNGYERESGTSMAAPVVTGVAALLMAYFPELNALDVKHVLVNSAARHPGQSVLLPGTKRSVLFGSLSSTGGIVNAYAAVKMAQQMVGHR